MQVTRKAVRFERVRLDGGILLWHPAENSDGSADHHIADKALMNKYEFCAGDWPDMIKSELIAKIAADNPHLYQRDVERIVATIFDEITDALSRGDRVELRGFGAFSVKHRAKRVGRNPRTGETVQVGEKFVPYFKTGKKLRDRLNEDGAATRDTTGNTTGNTEEGPETA